MTSIYYHYIPTLAGAILIRLPILRRAPVSTTPFPRLDHDPSPCQRHLSVPFSPSRSAPINPPPPVEIVTNNLS